MADIKCTITSEPREGTRVVLRQTRGRGAYFMGDGDVRFYCGNCDFILAKNVSEEQIKHQFHTLDGLGIILQCPRCKEFNEMIT
jgi:hypothetical protein